MHRWVVVASGTARHAMTDRPTNQQEASQINVKLEITIVVVIPTQHHHQGGLTTKTWRKSRETGKQTGGSNRSVLQGKDKKSKRLPNYKKITPREGDGEEETNDVGAAMSIRLLLLQLPLLNQRNAALPTRRLADPAQVVPGGGLPVREDVAAGHLLQLRRAQVLLRRPRGLVTLEDITREVSEFLGGDLLRSLHHTVLVGLAELDIAYLL